MKTCIKCLEVKKDTDFGPKKNRSGSISIRNVCKMCQAKRLRDRRLGESTEEKQARLLKQKEWNVLNRDKTNTLKAKYRTIKKIVKLSSIPHDSHVIAYTRYIEKISTVMYDGHVREWASNRAIKARWMQRNDMSYVVFNRLKRGVQRCFNNKHVSTDGWFVLLGYTTEDLKRHIEKQFTYGMDWDNRHEWHIDHIKPLCSYDIKSINDIEFKECFGLDNLRPVWAHHNRVKYNCYDKYMNVKKFGSSLGFF